MPAEYQPMNRDLHSTEKVGDYLYMWGGHHNKSMSPVMEVCHLPTGRWERKITTGNPPQGVYAYASAVIGNEIFYFGGQHNSYHNSLYSFNVNTFNWKELSPTSLHCHPMVKGYCGMVALQLDGEDYLVVIGGLGPSPVGTPTQAGAQYGDPDSGTLSCNEIHYYRLSSGQYYS